MTTDTVVVALAGALIGFGIWVVISRPTGQGVRRVWAVADRRFWTRLALALGAGLLVLVASGWIAAGAGVFLAVLAYPQMFGAASEQRATIARLEGVAVWVEALRDTIATSRGLPEALPAASTRAPQTLQTPMTNLVARMHAREPLEATLRRLADEIDDPIADQVIATLILNIRSQGRQLQAVLTSLAIATRREVDTRRRIEAERRSTRRGTVIIMVATVVFTTGLIVLYPQRAAAFSTPSGQVALGIALGLFVTGFVIMRRLARYSTPDRFLTTEVQP